MSDWIVSGSLVGGLVGSGYIYGGVHNPPIGSGFICSGQISTFHTASGGVVSGYYSGALSVNMTCGAISLSDIDVTQRMNQRSQQQDKPKLVSNPFFAKDRGW